MFGSWLRGAIAARGLSQNEFADAIRASKSSVSRWINGDAPKAEFIERIADVLVLDYDVVATKAGYRPRELMELDPESPEAQLVPLIRQVDWASRPGRLEEMQAELRFMIDVDRRNQRGRTK